MQIESVWEPAPVRVRVSWSGLGRGLGLGYLSLIVLLPLAAVVWRSTEGGAAGFWQAVSNPAAVAALRLTLVASLAVVVVNAVLGTVIAWVLVRDRFPASRS